MQAPLFFAYYLVSVLVVAVIGFINPRVEKSEEARARDWLYSHEDVMAPVIFITRRLRTMTLFRLTIVLDIACAVLFFLEPNNIALWGMNNIPTAVSIILGIVIFFAGWFIMYMMLNLTDSIQAMQLRKYYVRKYGVIVEDLIDE